MKDVISSVDTLLNMGLAVHIYNGQLDLICDTPGTEQWMVRRRAAVASRSTLSILASCPC